MSITTQRFIVLFIVEMWERFSYYGMRALLVLFLVNHLGFSDKKAIPIYSIFMALSFAGPIIGGILADKLMGFRNMVLIGGIIMTLGHAVMAIPFSEETSVLFGLGLIAVGTGMFKGNITNLLGTFYKSSDPKRDKAFTLFYVAVNLGSFLGSTTCAIVQKKYGYHYGFGLAGIGMAAGLVVFALSGNIIGNHGKAPNDRSISKAEYFGFISPLILVLFGGILAAYVAAGIMKAIATTTIPYLMLIIVSVLFGLVANSYAYIVYKSDKQTRKNLIALAVMFIFLMLFFIMELQIGSLINLFTDRNVNRDILGFTVPTAWSQSINPLSIMICGPLLAGIFGKWGPRGSSRRLFIGLFMMGLCFAILYLGCLNAENNLVNYAYLFISITIMGSSELFIAPLVQAQCTILSPKRLSGFMMGVLMLCIAFAAILGGVIAETMVVESAKGVVNPAESLSIYKTGFFRVMVFNFVIAALFLFFAKYVQGVINKNAEIKAASPTTIS